MNKKILNTFKSYEKNSYSPYSKYKVVAMLFAESGNVYMGVNVENASYSLTMCAERSALFCAVSNKERRFEKIIIFARGKKLPYPCGACLQALSEFAGEDFRIIVSNGVKEEEKRLSEYLPNRFVL